MDSTQHLNLTCRELFYIIHKHWHICVNKLAERAIEDVFVNDIYSVIPQEEAELLQIPGVAFCDVANL